MKVLDLKVFGGCKGFLLPNLAIIAICFPGIIRCVSQEACVAVTQDNFKRSVFGRRSCANRSDRQTVTILCEPVAHHSVEKQQNSKYFFLNHAPFALPALKATETSGFVVMKNCTSAPFLFKQDVCFQGKSKFALNAGKIKLL